MKRRAKVKKSPKKVKRAKNKFAVFNKLVKAVKKTRDWEERSSVLDKLGFKSLDSGAFSEVFEHPEMPGVVVKDTGQFDSWTKYARAVMAKKKSNPAFPKIHKYAVAGPRRLALMERLEEAESLNDLNDVEDYTMGRKATLPDWVDKNFKQALNVVKQIKKKNKHGVSIDIHGRNIMRRGSQLVLTDPIS